VKISKLFALTLQAKIRHVFLVITLLYNFVLGFYLKDFLILSQTLMVFYLLSALPCLFLFVEIKSKTMRIAVSISLILIACMDIAYAIHCRRAFPFLVIISLAIVLMYYTAFSSNTSKDNLLTKIYVLIISAFIIALLFSAYIFVYKQDDISLANGQATLWDIRTVELADEFCADRNTDEDKVKAIYEWITHNFEYDYECEPIIQYFNVRKTLNTRKGICYDFAHLFAALCRSQNIPCYVVDGTKIDDANYHHTWNRVYFNDSWWNVDVTFDAIQIQRKNKLYGFQRIEKAFSPDEKYNITKIY
jgi:hypothetical protein